MLPLRTLVLSLVLSGAIGAASAASYELEFRGTVTAISGIAGAAVGEAIAGRLTYTDAPDSGGFPSRGLYEQVGQAYAFSAGSFARSDVLQRVVVFNDASLGLYSPGDGIEYQGLANGRFDTGTGTYFYVSVLGTSGALDSVALPATAPDLAAFVSRSLFWGVDSRLSPGGPYLLGTLTSVSLVPEAATPAMLLTGLGLLAALATRRRAA